MIRLYKFRSLEIFERVEDILLNNRFYMANWRELNDPMEGHFNYIAYDTDLASKEILKQFIINKINLKICSFSKTFNPILLWSHYADQHKGIAIEIKVDVKSYENLYKVKYGKNIPELKFNLNPSPIDVLTQKIKFWAYEREYRVIDDRSSIFFGRITGVYFGVRTSNFDKEKIARIVNNSVRLYDTKIDFDRNRVLMKKRFSLDSL